MLKLLRNGMPLLLCLLLLLVHCSKELSCEDCREKNTPPLANAGSDQVISLPQDSALLDGSLSTDPDGKIVAWQWRRVAGPTSITLTSSATEKTLAKGLVAGVYQVELQVTDDGGATARDTVLLLVDNPGVNQPPVARAGADQTITLPLDSVVLDGSGSADPDNNISSYQWVQVSGPAAATISNATAVQTTAGSMMQGVYLFQLVVTDAGGLSARDTVQVTVYAMGSNHPPIACAGADRMISLPANAVTLDGSCSSDPDNNITSYSWVKLNGPAPASLTNAQAVQTGVTNLIEGVYQFELTVTDAGGLSSKDTVQVMLTACNNSGRSMVQAQLVQVGTLSQARAGMTVANTGNKILFAGGRPINGYGTPSRVDIFDVATNSWSIAELCIGRYGIAAVAAGDRVFFGGGDLSNGVNPVDSVDIYHVSTNSWSVAHLSAPGNGIAAATAGSKVIFAGGNDGFGGSGRQSRVDIYDLSANNWSIATLGDAKWGGVAAVTANNKIYVAGGEDYFWNNISSRIDIYDATTNTWGVSQLAQPKASYAAIGVGNRIYWASGKSLNSSVEPHSSCQVEIRDLTTGTSQMQALSSPAFWNVNDGQNAVVRNNQIVFYSTSGSITQRFDIYDIATNTWRIGVLPFAMDGASIIAVNNTIYVAGGWVNGALSNKVWKLEF